jgi:L-alanine-DL-glutamate epimerase-like enolase superfamily enzyme
MRQKNSSIDGAGSGIIDSDELAIIKAESYLLKVPSQQKIMDSRISIETWDILAVKLTTRSGLQGWGYQCGFGRIMEILRDFIDTALFPQIMGQNASNHKQWWHDIYLNWFHTGIHGPVLQGISAPEVAAWDLVARFLEQPLWKLLGEKSPDRVLCYDTNCGFFGYSRDKLVDHVKRSVDQGYRAIKVKIGQDDFALDMKRLKSVRKAVGDEVIIATDVNCKWDIQKALQCAPELAEMGIAWLEEPIYAFDIRGHAELCAAISTPVLHGESICEPFMFRDMLAADAMDIVQPSEMKLGGISRWLEVVNMAKTHGKQVVPAGWTIMQIDQHLAAATGHCWMVEVFGDYNHIFQEPVCIQDGEIHVSNSPGAGTALCDDALEKYGV